MAKIKCGYCGQYYEEVFEGHLDNGSNCCPECEKDEEKRKAEGLEKKEEKE